MGYTSLLALILVFAMTVAALADSGTITIQNSLDNTSPLGRTFNAYSILDVNLSTGDVPVYTVPDAMKPFYASYFGLDFTGKTQAWIDDAVFNKIDAFTYVEKEDDDLTPATRDNINLEEMKRMWMNKLQGNCLFISAKEKINIEALKSLLYERVKEIHITRFPYNDFLFQQYDEDE